MIIYIQQLQIQSVLNVKKQTPVICFASDTIVEIQEDEELKTEIQDDVIHFIFDVDNPPKILEEYLKEKYNYYRYSKFTDSYYYRNHCSHCDILQSNFYLHGEVDSPFYIYDIEDAENITLLKFKLDFDLELCFLFSWSSTDDLIEQYSEIKYLII